MDKIRQLLNPREVDMVLYHANCHDGFGAAWVANTILGPNAQYIGISYQSKSDFDPRGRNIVLLDFSFDLATCQKIKSLAKNFVILDHHKTAAETLAKLDYAYFDMEKSGITLAWEYFRSDSVPEFIKCIETHDLWKFEERKETCPHAKSFTTYWYNIVGQNPKVDFEHYYQLYQDPSLFYIYLDEGYTLLKYIDNVIKKKADTATDMFWHGPDARVYRAKVINTDTFISELGNHLSNQNNVDFAALWSYNHKYHNYRISLRSNGATDVSAIAKLYGGGGHRASSGFTLFQHPDTIFSMVD